MVWRSYNEGKGREGKVNVGFGFGFGFGPEAASFQVAVLQLAFHAEAIRGLQGSLSCDINTCATPSAWAMGQRLKYLPYDALISS